MAAAIGPLVAGVLIAVLSWRSIFFLGLPLVAAAVAIYLQTAMGYSPLAAGAATLPVTLLMIGLASRFGRLAERTGPRGPMTLGIVLTGAGLGLLAFLKPGASYEARVLPGIVLFGLGLAMTVPPLTNTAVSSVPDSQARIASGVNDAAARVAALLGVALCGLVFEIVFRAWLDSVDGATIEREDQQYAA